jgi:hypothetical protein
MLAVLPTVLLAMPGGAFASARVTPQDRAATLALLEARYTYEQAVVAATAASKQAVEALARNLAAECPGVLAGAPGRIPESLLGRRSRTPRQIGEANRELTQRSDLTRELEFALTLARNGPDRQATLEYAGALKSLRWSAPALTALEQADASSLELSLRSAPPHVCADIGAWAASGYRTLAPDTKALVDEQEAIELPFVRLLQGPTGGLSATSLLPYEGPREKALAHKLSRLELESGERDGFDALDTQLERALGVLTQAEVQAREEDTGHPKGSVEIGHGTTAAGGSYAVWIEPRHHGGLVIGGNCKFNVTVEETEGSDGSGAIEILWSGSSGACLPDSHPQPPSVQCQGEGHIAIEAQTPPGVRTVRLQLSDGRRIASHVALVPAKLGGPVGFYYQVVKGPSPTPVSLTELDAHGRVLRVVELAHVAKCVDQERKLTRGGRRTIATAGLPEGPRFSIVGERFSFGGETHLELRAEVVVQEDEGVLGDLTRESGGGRSSTAKPSPFSLETKTGCHPHEYALLYGILKAPADTVLARVAGALRPFQRAQIPRSLHAHGVLAYTALAVEPSEVIVRTPAGKTVFSKSLAGASREVRETCEGEAEG